MGSRSHCTPPTGNAAPHALFQKEEFRDHAEADLDGNPAPGGQGRNGTSHSWASRELKRIAWGPFPSCVDPEPGAPTIYSIVRVNFAGAVPTTRRTYMCLPASSSASTMVRTKPGPPESESLTGQAPAVKSAAVPAQSSRLVPGESFSNEIFSTELALVDTGAPVTRYLPLASTTPVMVVEAKILPLPMPTSVAMVTSFQSRLPFVRAGLVLLSVVEFRNTENLHDRSSDSVR